MGDEGTDNAQIGVAADAEHPNRRGTRFVDLTDPNRARPTNAADAVDDAELYLAFAVASRNDATPAAMDGADRHVAECVMVSVFVHVQAAYVLAAGREVTISAERRAQLERLRAPPETTEDALIDYLVHRLEADHEIAAHLARYFLELRVLINSHRAEATYQQSAEANATRAAELVAMTSEFN